MKIELLDIVKYYDDCCVFDSLNAEFSSNLIRLEGNNGSGKSTLLKILSASTSFKGNILIDGKKQTNDFLNRNVILVHQDIILLENKTVMNNLNVLHISKENYYIENLIEKDLLFLKVNELSGGQKKLLSLAIAFAIEPSILLLDEFSNYLDDNHLEQIKKIIVDYSKKHMIIYVDHLVDLGGDVFSLDKCQIEYKTSVSSVSFKKRNFTLSFYYFIIQFRVISILSFLVNFILFSCIMFCLSIVTVSSYRIAAEYYLKNDLNYIQVKPNVKDVRYSLYYGVRLDFSERKDVLENFYYVTYYENFDFSLKEEVEEIQDSLPCYVFDMSSSYLGQAFVYRNIKYYVKGVIDYPYSSDTTIVALPTFFIEGEKPIEDETYLTMAHFTTDRDLIQAFNKEEVFIENSGFLSAIHQSLRKSVFNVFLAILIFINLLFQILSTIFYVRGIKPTHLFLNQYGNSNLELGVTRIGAEVMKYLSIGIGGYFLVAYLISLYETNVIFPWSTMMEPSIIYLILTLFLFVFLKEGIFWIINRKRNL